jgi:predicted transcriptional regulator
MRHKSRFQPYVSPEVHRKVQVYAAARGLTESAVANAALSEYVERDQFERSLVERRLDLVVETNGQVLEQLNALAEAFAVHAKYSFRTAPPPQDPAALQRSDGIYAEFLTTVARRVQAGRNLSRELRRRVTATAAPAIPTKPKGGQ